MKHTAITERVVKYIMVLSLKELSQITCYQIAEEFKINNCYLSSKFKKDTNILLFDFIEGEKMIRARRLLETRLDLTIEDISRMSGSEKIEQFRAKFKKHFFVTPGIYRKFYKKTK